MKITKFQHACFVVEKDGQSLVVDPGSFTHDLIVPKKVAAIVVTHNHPDHCDKNQVIDLLDRNPKAVLIADQSVIDLFPGYETRVAHVGERLEVAAFTLDFIGGTHAIIYPGMNVPPNLGVFINEQLYYPGDSFEKPTIPVHILALPVSAPWLRAADSIEFLRSVKPSFSFPTHDAILSDEGQALVDGLMSKVARSLNVTYQRINGTPIEVQ